MGMRSQVLLVRNIFDGGIMRFVVLLHKPLRCRQFRAARIGIERTIEGCDICGGHDVTLI